jgi:large subunit ribosomal protein L6
MSRIGKLSIKLPEKVNVSFKDGNVTVSGPKGTLVKYLRFNGAFQADKTELRITTDDLTKEGKARYGLVRSVVNNMVTGVTSGYKKTLKIIGVGYKAQLQGKSLMLNLGYSHVINYSIPEGIKIEVPDPNTVVVNGTDRELVGQVSANIRGFKPPEPYKGKGIMYSDERVRRKAGKAGAK